MFRRLAVTFAAAVAFSAPSIASADDYSEAREIVQESRITIQRVLRDSETGPRVKNLMSKAKGVLVFPEILKGAFIIGGEGGSGVLMSRQANGSWSYPAFYTMGSVSIGLQIGGESSQAMLLVMTQKGFDAILNDQVKLGADISAAAGPRGIGAEASTTTATGADIYVYSLNKGLFIGASLEGAVIAKRGDWNSAFYKKTVSPRDIVRDNMAENVEADPLRAILEEND